MYSPLILVSFLRDLLREMFAEYGGEEYSWDPDPKVSDLMIGTVNDMVSMAKVQKFPRILVQRGPSFAQSQFLNNNLQSSIGGGVPSGGSEVFRQDISGSINFVIEARNEGTCEDLAEFLRRFICWSKPFIETRFGFQAFAKQIQISQCDLTTEDTEKFKISINIPYIIEDRWQKTGDLVRLSHVFNKMTQAPDSGNH